ncbi:hypothetical protein D3C72_1289460 [compost metagenome]
MGDSRIKSGVSQPPKERAQIPPGSCDVHGALGSEIEQQAEPPAFPEQAKDAVFGADIHARKPHAGDVGDVPFEQDCSGLDLGVPQAGLSDHRGGVQPQLGRVVRTNDQKAPVVAGEGDRMALRPSQIFDGVSQGRNDVVEQGVRRGQAHPGPDINLFAAPSRCRRDAAHVDARQPEGFAGVVEPQTGRDPGRVRDRHGGGRIFR